MTVIMWLLICTIRITFCATSSLSPTVRVKCFEGAFILAAAVALWPHHSRPLPIWELRDVFKFECLAFYLVEMLLYMCFETTSLEITVVVFAYSFSGNPQHLFFFFKESGLPLYQTKYPGNAKRTCITYISKVEVIKTLQPRHCDEIWRGILQKDGSIKPVRLMWRCHFRFSCENCG